MSNTSKEMKSEAYCIDCLDYMSGIPDKTFDVAIVDPPYGIGADWKKRNRGAKFERTTYTNDSIPTAEYFSELKRVSKEQIIFGYNYFVEMLGPTNYLIIWDKKSANNKIMHYSKCEIAYTSFHIPCNIVSIEWDGYRMGAERGHKKIHPHQKPVALYDWLIAEYVIPNGFTSIFDSHIGSGSSRIAASKAGLDFTGCELDPTYFAKQEARFKAFNAQLTIF